MQILSYIHVKVEVQKLLANLKGTFLGTVILLIAYLYCNRIPTHDEVAVFTVWRYIQTNLSKSQCFIFLILMCYSVTQIKRK